jgi:hypothetical protein
MRDDGRGFVAACKQARILLGSERRPEHRGRPTIVESIDSIEKDGTADLSLTSRASGLQNAALAARKVAHCCPMQRRDEGCSPVDQRLQRRPRGPRGGPSQSLV